MRPFIAVVCACLVACTEVDTPPSNIVLTSSPIVGDVGMRNARIWCQLTPASTGVPAVVLLDSTQQVQSYTPMSTTGLGNCYEVDITNLEPGNKYAYFIAESSGRAISDTLMCTTQPLWQYRTDPPELSMLVGSCTYINEPSYDRPGKAYGGGYEIFDAMANESYDAMVWLGDNIYLREVDVASRSGFVHRYTHTRSTPEMQRLLSKGAHYAIWDDHDFGPNDCDGSWVHAEWSLQAFDAFWPNPDSGIPGAPELNATQFQFGDLEFFLLDNRTHRVNHTMGPGKRQILGEVQRNWLVQALRNSRAPFKLVAIGGQMISDAAIYENFAQFPEERAWLLEQINELDIRGVVFLTGDRHNSELSKLQLPGGNWVYDWTVSPLTSGSYNHEDEPNTLREPGTMVGDRNYGLLEVTGPRKERVMTMTVRGADGETVWTRSISAGNGYKLN